MENISISDNFVQQAQQWLLTANLSLPASLAGSDLIQDLLSPQQSDPSSPRQGCGNDPFAIFGFLAFILVILQLLANQGNRKRREAEFSGRCHQESGQGSGHLAAAIIFQGFLNGFDGNLIKAMFSKMKNNIQGGSLRCRERHFCEGIRSASQLGPEARVISELSAEAAPRWLPGLTSRQRRRVTRAGLRGLLARDCGSLYPCHQPSSQH